MTLHALSVALVLVTMWSALQFEGVPPELGGRGKRLQIGPFMATSDSSARPARSPGQGPSKLSSRVGLVCSTAH
jgi:hypothetical protein